MQELLNPPLKDEIDAIYRTYFFVHSGKQAAITWVREAILSGFTKYMACQLSISEYRHVAEAFMEKWIKKNVSIIPLEITRQAGHSTNTGTTSYAATAEDRAGISRGILEFYIASSECWHVFLKLRPGVLEGECETSSVESRLINALRSNLDNLNQRIWELNVQVTSLRESNRSQFGILGLSLKLIYIFSSRTYS